MINCEICGGVDFEKYAGFMYCTVCQTQSQDFHEQAYEFNEADQSRKQQTPKTESKRTATVQDDGVWTSWEEFNFILYGMTQELMKALPLPSEFESQVLKLWACYLKACNVGFVSLFNENLPQLTYNFKHRDARVLYKIDVDRLKPKKIGKTNVGHNVSNKSSFFHESRNSMAKRRTKLIDLDYKDHLLMSAEKQCNLKDATLESLGKTMENEDLLKKDLGDGKKELMECFKKIFSPSDFKMLKSVARSERPNVKVRDQAKKSIKSLAKNKLLSILHLALLMTGSKVQLSDLMRLIRESHLSYAKITHFLPKEVKFSKNDITYVDVVSDCSMPTHLSQRKITNQLAHLLQIEKIMIPDMCSLVRRYCQDLNLPSAIAVFGEKILANWIFPDFVIIKSHRPHPSYEAWAMSSIIVVLKMLLGFNDKTEIFLSDLAREINGMNDSSDGSTSKKPLFVFEEWQKFIECRKNVLIKYHYPTQEQLDVDGLTSSKKFLHTLMRESKDEHRAERFIPYNRYYIKDCFMKLVRSTLEQLITPMEFDFVEFEPSLTPQTSYLESILSIMEGKRGEKEVEKEEEYSEEAFRLPRDILQQSFRNYSVDFAFCPKKYLKLLGKNKNKDPRKNIRFYAESISRESSSSSPTLNLLTNSSSGYWMLHYGNTSSRYLTNFKDVIFDKMPDNFQWLMKECSRMLEMNVRDVYNEVINLEKFLLGKKKMSDGSVLFLG